MHTKLLGLQKGAAFEGLTGPGRQLADLIEAGAVKAGAQASILDLGFKDHGSLVTLHHTFGLRRYVGVDTMPRDRFRLSIKPRGVEQVPEELVRPSTSNEEYQEYLLFHKYRIAHGKPLSKRDYHQVFELLFELSALDFLKKNVEQFDIVILSDVLHFTDSRFGSNEVVDLAVTATKSGGLLYVQVYLDEAPDLSPEKYPLSHDEYKALKERMKTILHEGEVSKGHVRLIGLT